MNFSDEYWNYNYEQKIEYPKFPSPKTWVGWMIIVNQSKVN